MFDVDNLPEDAALIYIPGGERVIVKEVHDRHLVAETDDDREETFFIFFIYEDEYDLYRLED